MDRLTVLSPAKINLGLRVTEKRDDGFHNLETIFYPINLSDELKFTRSDKFQFKSNHISLEEDKSNLVIKAVKLLENTIEESLPVKIELTKNIPVGGGLGGGSSDAASTLNAINKLFDLNLSRKKMMELSLKLGSDVPFFIDPKPSLAKGRGEVLKVIPLKIDLPILIINPGIHISTKWAFENIKPRTPEKSIDNLTLNSFEDLMKNREHLMNDFEELVFSEYPLLRHIKNYLDESGSLFTAMSGTGSTIYGIFDDMITVNNLSDNIKQYFTFVNIDK